MLFSEYCILPSGTNCTCKSFRTPARQERPLIDLLLKRSAESDFYVNVRPEAVKCGLYKKSGLKVMKLMEDSSLMKGAATTFNIFRYDDDVTYLSLVKYIYSNKTFYVFTHKSYENVLCTTFSFRLSDIYLFMYDYLLCLKNRSLCIQELISFLLKFKITHINCGFTYKFLVLG